jgi:hypothetical protein
MNLRKVLYEHSPQDKISTGDIITLTETSGNESPRDNDIPKGNDKGFDLIKSTKDKRPRAFDEVPSIMVTGTNHNDSGKRYKTANDIDMDLPSQLPISRNTINNEAEDLSYVGERAEIVLDDDVLCSPPSFIDSEMLEKEIFSSDDAIAPPPTKSDTPTISQDVIISCDIIIDSHSQSHLIPDAQLVQNGLVADTTDNISKFVDGPIQINKVDQPKMEDLMCIANEQLSSTSDGDVLQAKISSPKSESPAADSGDLGITYPEVVPLRLLTIPSSDTGTSIVTDNFIVESNQIAVENLRENVGGIVNDDASTAKLYTSLCDVSTTASLLHASGNADSYKSEVKSMYNYSFKPSLHEVKSVLLGALRRAVQLHHLLLQCGRGQSI